MVDDGFPFPRAGEEDSAIFRPGARPKPTRLGSQAICGTLAQAKILLPGDSARARSARYRLQGSR